MAEEVTEIPRSCNACKGQVIQERDWHGTWGSCIMCGKDFFLTKAQEDVALKELEEALCQGKGTLNNDEL